MLNGRKDIYEMKEMKAEKKIIPIVFCFDDNMRLQAGVCITSLLLNARPETFYDIFILHGEQCSFENSELNKLPLIYGNCRIQYRCVGRAFESAFEIRGITIATYYRLLIPEIIPEYDKIIYSDVDVIFRNDLSEIFESTNMEGYYVAGVADALGLQKHHHDYIENKLGLTWTEYICAGNLILNLTLLRQDDMVERFINKVKTSTYKYQDQDILNIVCKGKILRMSPTFSYSADISLCAADMLETPLYTQEELREAQAEGIVHYTGPKPWWGWCPNFDIWWEYYRKSIWFNPKVYCDFYVSRQSNADLDCLSLWKRIKILIRYFKNGRKQLKQRVNL